MSQVAYLNPHLLGGGKREQTKVANRQAILDAAREVFGELGYETATVRDIIRRTGLAAGTFYNYYRSKEEVFAALADDGARRFAPILKALRGKGYSFEDFVQRAIEAYFAELGARGLSPVVLLERPAVGDAMAMGHLSPHRGDASCTVTSKKPCDPFLSRRH